MQNQPHSEHFLKQRRFYTLLPLIVLPFLTVFYAVAVSKINAHQSTAVATGQGLNMTLPDAIINQGKLVNKLSYYEKAAQDSVRRAQLLKKDPYFQDSLLAASAGNEEILLLAHTPPGSGSVKTKHGSGPKTDQVYQKLEALETALNSASEPSFKTPKSSKQLPSDADAAHLEKQLQTLLAQANRQDPPEPSQDPLEPSNDPELAALSGMLDKIIQIQNPELAKQNVLPDNPGLASSRVSLATKTIEPSLLQAQPVQDSAQHIPLLPVESGFFSLEDEPTGSTLPKAIEAVIDQNPKLVTGSTVKLKLSTDIFIQGHRIREGSFLFGTASLSGERLNIQIKSIHHESALFPVNLTVYDLDGQPGLYIPGAITREVAKQSAAQAAGGLNLGSLDQSLGAQAADAAIQASKTLLSRKAKLQQVSIREGYRVLLYDKNGSGAVSR